MKKFILAVKKTISIILVILTVCLSYENICVASEIVSAISAKTSDENQSTVKVAFSKKESYVPKIRKKITWFLTGIIATALTALVALTYKSLYKKVYELINDLHFDLNKLEADILKMEKPNKLENVDMLKDKVKQLKRGYNDLMSGYNIINKEVSQLKSNSFKDDCIMVVLIISLLDFWKALFF